MVHKTKHQLKSRVAFSKVQLITVALVFAAVGGYAIYRSFAAGATTFGITVPGNTTDSLGADQKQVAPYTSTQAGTISKITGYISGLGAGSGTQNVKAIVYADSSGTPGALLGVSTAVTVNAGQAFGWVDFNFATPVSVPSGKVWLGYLGSTTSTLTQISANVVSGNNLIFAPNTGGYAAGPNNPFGGNQSTNGYQYVLYATYGTSSLAGDLNNDGTVDGADLSILLANWNATSGVADINTDNKVDILDLSALLSHFGNINAPQPTVTISASPSSIASGGSSTITWSSTNANSCTASGSWSGNKATSGSVSTGALNADATYTLSCTGSGGSASNSATVTITSISNSIYWGAYIEGVNTYAYYFPSGVPWSNAPLVDPGTSNAWDKFEADAGGKKISLSMVGQNNFWSGSFQQVYLDAAYNRGAIPVVDMSGGQGDSDGTPFSDITSGKYDAQITAWAQAAKNWGHPFFLRWDAEMNGHWYQYGRQAQTNPQGFIDQWRHIHDIFTQVGANNVSWHWCPNDDVQDPESPLTPLESLYPGDAYVDWTGMTGYSHASGESLSWVFDSTYNRVVAVSPSKPMQIGEIGAVDAGYPGNKVQFINDFFAALPTKYSHVKAFVWFNWRINENGPDNPIWWDWPIESSAASQTAFQQGISSSYYENGSLEKSFPLGTKVPIP